jgi:hypothetical protein
VGMSTTSMRVLLALARGNGMLGQARARGIGGVSADVLCPVTRWHNSH